MYTTETHVGLLTHFRAMERAHGRQGWCRDCGEHSTPEQRAACVAELPGEIAFYSERVKGYRGRDCDDTSDAGPL